MRNQWMNLSFWKIFNKKMKAFIDCPFQKMVRNLVSILIKLPVSLFYFPIFSLLSHPTYISTEVC